MKKIENYLKPDLTFTEIAVEAGIAQSSQFGDSGTGPIIDYDTDDDYIDF